VIAFVINVIEAPLQNNLPSTLEPLPTVFAVCARTVPLKLTLPPNPDEEPTLGKQLLDETAHLYLVPWREPVSAKPRFAATIDQKTGWHRPDGQTLRCACVSIAQDEEGHRLVAQEVGDRRIVAVDAHGHNHQTAFAHLLVEPAIEGQRAPARHAPGGPEIEEHDLASELVEPHLPAVKVGQGQAAQLFAQGDWRRMRAGGEQCAQER
jgi:hypothetical protein